MEDKDIMIASLRKEVQELYRKISALEQENALLNDDISRLKRQLEIAKKKD